MKAQSQIVFDEIVTGAQKYTSAEFNHLLGIFDYLAIHAVVDKVDVTGTLTVQVQHAADNRNFLSKNATAEINAQGITTGSATSLVGFEPGINPSLAFVRLAITLGGSTTSAHVKIHITMRDQVGGVWPSGGAM